MIDNTEIKKFIIILDKAKALVWKVSKFLIKIFIGKMKKIYLK